MNCLRIAGRLTWVGKEHPVSYCSRETNQGLLGENPGRQILVQKQMEFVEESKRLRKCGYFREHYLLILREKVEGEKEQFALVSTCCNAGPC